MSSWSFIYDGFEPEKEGLREALCTLGNGYFATRGAAAENDADGVHYPGTYLAGGYNRLKTEIAGRVVENEDLVNIPNWLPLKFKLEGSDWFNLSKVKILYYRQKLDMYQGVLHRCVRFEDEKGRICVLRNRRIVSMSDPHLAVQETTLLAENFSGKVEILSALDGKVTNSGVKRYLQLNNQHLVGLLEKELGYDSMLLKVQTSQSEIRIAQGARTKVFVESEEIFPERKLLKERGYIGQKFEVNLNKGQLLRLEKTVSLFTSRDSAISECSLQAEEALYKAGSFQEILEPHAKAWKHLWQQFDIDLFPKDPNQGDRMARVLRLYTFHLLQTTSPHTMDLDVGVPSRGWHGEAYRGHIFWDEIYIFPTLNLRMPEITRSLLMYRFRRLGAARKAAKEAGLKGAMYPWQSGSSGREETQRLHLNPKSGRWLPDNSYLQRHVNSAIAYNIWQYFQITKDLEFLGSYGAEMFFEIARFWASMASWNEKTKRYEINGVMGPDEYHDAYPWSEKPGLNNNAYTNVMASWIWSRALEMISILPQPIFRRLKEKIKLSDEEIKMWSSLAKKMTIIFHDDGIISQFEGYDKLAEFDWDGYREKYGDIQRLDRILEAEGDSTNRYKVSKQADVLMLFYLFSQEELEGIFQNLGYPFDERMKSRNTNYYMQRTSHGSTLSRVVHSWVLVSSQNHQSWQLFSEALESDVADIQGGTTPEGIHLGAMAGTVDILQRAYTGLEARGNMLRFNPILPEELDRLHFHMRYRGHELSITITPSQLTIKDLPTIAGPIDVCIKGKTKTLPAGGNKTITFSL